MLETMIMGMSIGTAAGLSAMISVLVADHFQQRKFRKKDNQLNLFKENKRK